MPPVQGASTPNPPESQAPLPCLTLPGIFFFSFLIPHLSSLLLPLQTAPGEVLLPCFTITICLIWVLSVEEFISVVSSERGDAPMCVCVRERVRV